MMVEEGKVGVEYPARKGHPVRFAVDYPEKLSRKKGAQRALGAFITWAVPAGLGYVSAVFYLGLPVIIGSLIALGVISLPVVLAIRIRKKGARRFLAEDGPGLERHAKSAIATAAYALFLTDDPPERSLGASVRLELGRRADAGWVRAAVTPVLLLPHIILLALFAFAFLFIVPVCAVTAVVFERYPRWFFGFSVGYLRWIARALAYWLSLTDRYPPFSFAEDA